VVLAVSLVLVAVITLDLLVFGHLGLPFDVVFVLACAAAALAVRPRDFFVVGVLPPLLLAAVVIVLAVIARGVVADRQDVLPQAVVSGLAHHSGALVAGYALTLVVLALRQVALRNAGVLRSGAAPRIPEHSAAPGSGS
jgi:mannose/fructose/N-acetylgalactosamine-specific phosphotransferase system component IIC